MFFQIPRPVVEEGDNSNPSGRFSLTSFRSPLRLEFITTGKEGGPCITQKVGNEDDKSPPDSD